MAFDKPEKEIFNPVITNVANVKNGFNITWSDGFVSFFHFIWLRDCCYCDQCGDTYSSNRYIVPSDIPLDVKPESRNVDAKGNLCIAWLPDEHVSTYDATWLRRNCYDDCSRSARFHQPILWDSNLSDKIPVVGFDEARAEGRNRLQLYRELRDYGFVVITGGPCEAGSIEEVARLIGDLGESAYTKIFDLTPKSKTRTIGNTTRPVPPHTDEAFRFSPPGINIISCVRPADDGGESVLVDGFNLATVLREDDPQGFEMLTKYAQSFHRVHNFGNDKIIDERTRQPMFVLDDRGEVVGVRIHTRAAGPMTLPPEKVESYYAAHHSLSELMMSVEMQIKLTLNAGDSIVFDNHRVLHAREHFSDPERFLQICNVPRESFHGRLRELARQIGYQQEADMILCSGA